MRCRIYLSLRLPASRKTRRTRHSDAQQGWWDEGTLKAPPPPVSCSSSRPLSLSGPVCSKPKQARPRALLFFQGGGTVPCK